MQRGDTGMAAKLFAAASVSSGVGIAAGLLALGAGAGRWALYLAAAGLVAAATLAWARHATQSERERQLHRLVTGLEAAAGSAKPRSPTLDRGELDPLHRRLLRATAVLIERLSAPAASEARLAAIVGALPQPVVVITEQGLVSLANQAALQLLGEARLGSGTSLFDAIDRHSLTAPLERIKDGTPVEAELRLASGDLRSARLRALPEHGGAVIVLEGPAPDATGLVHALDLHHKPPPRRPPERDTPLLELNVVVLDCETTGLNVGLDRLLSLAAVHVQGDRLSASESIDLLFNPGEPIPPASTAIHGITDAMVLGERPLAQRWPEIAPMLRDCVVVGHNVGFDLTLLEIELRRAGIDWQRPPSLCTVQLASALDPTLNDLNLETVAQAYGIAVTGRHTALGDALVTAEIYLHLLALMQARGDRTLGQAQARAATARRVVRQQQAAGW